MRISIFSLHAVPGNPSHLEVSRGDAAGGYFGCDDIFSSGGSETTSSRGIWRNVKPIFVSDGGTLLSSRILPHQHHDRS